MNSHDRRKFRRKLIRSGQSVPGWAKVSTLVAVDNAVCVHCEDTATRVVEMAGKVAVCGDESLYGKGTVWKLNTDKYGVSYKGRRVTVLESPDAVDTVVVQLPKRKAPLTVFVSELDAVRADNRE